MKSYIIDGNNLIGKIREIKNVQVKDKQAAREKLIFLIENYFHTRKDKVYLHFDGFENLPLRITRGKIIYSEKLSADNKIKEQIESAKNRKDLTVVSSDHEIMNFARVCSCQIISSDEFAKSLYLINKADEEESRIRSIDNNEEFKRLFNGEN